MANTFTLSGTSLDAENNPAYAGRYMVLRVTSVATAVDGITPENGASYPQDSVSALIGTDGTWSFTTLWVNGDSGILSYYEMREPSGQRIEFVFPSEVEGTTVRYEFALENYLAEDAEEQVAPALGAHIADLGNPHQVTAAQVSLGATDDVTFNTITTGQAASSSIYSLDLATDTGFRGIGAGSQDFGYYRSGVEQWYAGSSGVRISQPLTLGTDLAITEGGTGASTALAATQNLGVEVGVDVQPKLQNSVIVTQASDLAGALDSTKAYVLDGIIDMGTQSITVPTGGLTILGQSFDISGLTSSEDNYTLFVSESIAIGSGNLLMADIDISTTGTNSKVYEIYDATGFNAIELARVNYTDCTSLGDLYDYRQGLEDGTGRFGGTPNLTHHGLWRGGFRITTSIVRGLDAGMTGALFQSGTLFQMDSRFLSDINCDLPASAALHDFAPVEFPNPGTVQLGGCEITRDGVYDAEDANLTPNMDRGDLCSYWKRNNGLPNTFVGATTSITSEELTTISAGSTYYDLEGIFTGTGLEHFSASADGKLTHLGNSPREFEVTSNLVLESTQNNQLTVRFRKWDDSASAFVNLDYTQQTRQVNNLSGARDVAYFTLLVGVALDQNDYLQLQVRNNSGGNNVTAELSSFFRVQER